MSAFEAKVTTKGQITLPAKLREDMKLRPGDKVLFIEEPDGTVRMEPKNVSMLELRGIARSGEVSVTGRMIEDWIEESRSARWDRSRSISKTSKKHRL
jgi:AbrB family looped-hinge helix DNA binding protein